MPCNQLTLLCPLGIIDLSQVSHILVPPSPGTVDRIPYIPGTSTGFPGRPYTTSPISPGTVHFTQADSHNKYVALFLFLKFSFSPFFLHVQLAPHT